MANRNWNSAIGTLRGKLLVSAAVPVALLGLNGVARADQVVVVGAPTTVFSLNAQLAAAAATPDRNVALSVTAPGEVTGPGTVFLFATPGQADGVIGFTNAGALGAAADGVVTDNVRFQYTGNVASADNSVTGANSGLISGGYSSTSVGGTNSLENSGTIFGGVALSGRGDAQLKTSGTGTIETGNVTVQSQVVATTETVDGVTTTTWKGGSATAELSSVGTTEARGSVNVSGQKSADVSISGAAGNVNATAQTNTDSVSKPAVPEAGKTVTTVDQATKIVGGTASVTLAEGADVSNVTATGINGATVTSAGKSLAINANAAGTTVATLTRLDTVTQDADGKLLQTTNAFTRTATSGKGEATLASGAEATFVTVRGLGGATAQVDGKSTGFVQVVSNGTLTPTSKSESNFAADGSFLGSSSSSTTTAVGDAASATIGATGSAQSLFVTGTKSASAKIDGVVEFTTSVNASGSQFESQNSSVVDADTGITTKQTSSSKNTQIGGDASVSVGAAGKAADISVSTNAGAATGTVAGVANSLSANANGSDSSSNFLIERDATTGLVTLNESSSSSKSTGGAATVTVAAGGEVVNGVSASSGTGDASAAIAGSAGFVSASTSGFSTVGANRSTFDGKTGALLTEDSSNSSTALLNSATVTIADTGSAGSASASGGRGATATVRGAVEGSVTANSQATDSSNASSFVATYDAGGVEIGNKSADSSTQTARGGSATISVEARGSAGSLSGTADRGVAIVNAGSVGGSVSGTSNRFITSSNTSSTETTSTLSATEQADSSSFTSAGSSGSTGGGVSFANAAGAIVGASGAGSVNLNGVGGVGLINNGTVRGTTNASSTGSRSDFSNTSSDSSKTVFGIAPALDVTTSESSSSSKSSSATIGGNVTGTYAGANGSLNFLPAASGSVFQTAAGNSTATVSGAIFGNLTSTAGSGSASSFESAETTKAMLDSSGVGMSSGSSSTSNKSSSNSGTSTVTITGRVSGGEGVSGGTVLSQGSKSATATITGGTLSGSLSVVSNGISSSSNNSSNSYAQSWTGFTPTTTSIVESSGNASSLTDGTASATLSGPARVDGSVNVSGRTSSVDVGLGSKVGSSVNVTSGQGLDSAFESKASYTRDTKTGEAIASETQTSSNKASAANGSATATVAGEIGGSLSVAGGSGAASASVTGKVGGNVNASTGRSQSSSSVAESFTGKLPATSETQFGLAGVPGSVTGVIPAGGLLKVDSSSSTSWAGGAASVAIAADADVQKAGDFSASSVTANGLGGATVTIAAGSRLAGSASAFSDFTDSSSTTAEVAPPTGRTRLTTQIQTPVGGTASITNDGEVASFLQANAAGGASVTNRGESGGIFADALGEQRTTTISDLNFENVALRTLTTTVETTAIGGTATVNNAAGASVRGSISVAAKTGTVTNAGFVTGTTSLGQAVNSGTTTDTRTQGSTTFTYEAPTTRFAQTYTVNQTGWSRGYSVGGATINQFNPQTGLSETIQTSDIIANITLGNGSVTLGSITGQVDAETGERLTQTTVTLDGAGWLGVDAIAPQPPAMPTLLPSLVVPLAAQELYGTSPTSAVRVSGVSTVQKQGAGTFVIHGAALVPATAPGSSPSYTMDVGTFAINGGEVQLAVSGGTPAGATRPSFGIKGDVANNATLVLGRRVAGDQPVVGGSLVGTGPQRIEGISVQQVGNFTQGSGGTLVVAAQPSLVRFAPSGISTSGAASEPLGPVSGGVNIPFFTTPVNAGTLASASRLDVTGNLSLGGTVQLVVQRDALYGANDGFTLASYTGTGTVTATVAPTLQSAFVGFQLVNDTASKTVRVAAQRSSYASAATSGSNAAAAAVALDSALPGVISRITTDATGGAAFDTVGEIGRAQDMANVASALDWRLSGAQAAQLFDELSSAEIYGSLAAIDQNLVFRRTSEVHTAALLSGEDLRNRIWLNPVGEFSKFSSESDTGASGIRSTSYGLAFGGELAFATDGLFGFGGSYAEHDVSARQTDESARVRTWTIGAYATKAFDNIYLQGNLAYGFSRFDVDRQMELLARSASSNFRGTQFDASLEGGYRFDLGNNFAATPYARLGVRSWTMNEAEEDAAQSGAFGVIVEERSQSIFMPTIGARVNGTATVGNGMIFRPSFGLSYTFQGDIGSDITATYLGGGESFRLQGVDPSGFGTFDVGLDVDATSRVQLFLRGSYSYGSGNNATSIRGGVGILF